MLRKHLANGVLGFIVLTVISVSTYWIFTDNKAPLEATRQKNVLPSFQLQGLKGQEIHSQQFAGKPMLVNFWASWCPPCRKEFPALATLAELYSERLNVLAVSTDSKLTVADSFIDSLQKEKNIPGLRQNIVLGWDQQKSVSMNLFSVVRLPETFLVATNGEIVDKFIGEVDWMSAEIRQRIEKHLKK